MKKFTYLLLALFTSKLIIAGIVPASTAQSLAKLFYEQKSGRQANVMTIAYTESALNSDPVFYAFNINANDGFVIIAAENTAHPILGYSFENKFIVPESNTNIDYWMKNRAKEIAALRAANVPADNTVINEWNGNFTSTANERPINSTSTINSVVLPLVQTTWNQNPNYNALCPGGSVTGCVATAMAQIMKFWNYPNTGTGSSSYCDCTSQGFSSNYGTLSANYAATTYSWGSMPNSISGTNAAICNLMLHCGISVEMDYTPSGSGAWVITSDNPVCAQVSYVNYFKYDPATIQGLMRVYYTDPNWINLLETELTIGRPIQYVGYETNGDGHTWVCDGYDASNNFHMNWGWGGYDNGYYSINSLNANPYTFSVGHEALIGIKPLPYSNFSMGANTICAGQTISLNDLSVNSPTSWHYTLTGGTPSVSTVQNPTVTYATPGVYTISLITANSTNTSIAIVKTITVSSVPVLTITAAPICAGSTATISSQGAMSYTLNTGATGSNILVTPSISTNYTVNSFNGCTASKTVAVIVNPMPNVSATSNTMSVCAGDVATLNAAGATTYLWSDGSTNATAAVTPTASTVYFVTGTTGMCSNSASIALAYNNVPTVSISGTDSLLCAGQTITLTANGASTYTWSTGAIAPIITDVPMGNSSYTVTGATAAGCINKVIVTQPVSVCTGIKQETNAVSVGIYPNPNNGVFTVSLNKFSEGLVVEVFNALGQLVLKHTLKSLNDTVSLVNEANGIYNLRITDSGNLVYKTKISKN